MDFDSLQPDAPQGETPAQSQQASSQPLPANASFDDLQEDKPTHAGQSFDDLKEDKDYGTTGQSILAGVEGAAQGVLSPLITTPIELGLSKLGVPGLSAEDIAGRQEANPTAHGLGIGAGFVGSLLTGVGEGKILAGVGETAAKALGLGEATSNAGKIGSAVIKGLVENSGIQLGEELNKSMIGLGDPNTPVSSALAHIGAAGLFGGGIGGALGAAGLGAANRLRWLADTQMGQRASQFMEDFGQQWGFNQQNPNRVAAVFNEVNNFFKDNSEVMGDVYGSQGIKAEAIEKLVPEMNDAIKQQNVDISKYLDGKIKEMVSDPDTYEPRFAKKLIADTNNWMKVTTDPQADSNAIFNATQELKQKLATYAKFDARASSLSSENEFRSLAAQMQHELIGHLENTNVWGQAGELQQGINKAFSKFVKPQKDMWSRFSQKVEGEPNLDPNKFKTYISQLGKSGTSIDEEIRPKVMKNYITAAENYRNEISNIYGKLGLDSPVKAMPLSAVKATFDETTEGTRAANWLFHSAIPSGLGHGAGVLGGKVIGHMSGLPFGEAAGAVIGEGLHSKLGSALDGIAGRPIRGLLVPAAYKALMSGSPTGIAEALEHAGNVQKGASAIQNGVDALFTGSKIAGQQFVNDNPDKIKKIKEFVEKGGVNQQIQNTLHEQNRKKTSTPVQGFAHGGEVTQSAPITTPVITHQQSKFSQVYPDHSMLMEAAKGRVYNYLNTIRPQSNMPKLPFDEAHEDPVKAKSYESALKIAHKPLSVLPEIQKGTITPEHMKHLVGMWPEVHGELSKKITERLTKAQMNGEKKPPSHVRQGLSMFLGAPLDGTMQPGMIQAAQSVFANQKAQPQQGQPHGNVKNTSKLNQASKQYQTPDQASQARQLSDRS